MMSGRRRTGSSAGSGSCSIGELVPVNSTTRSANSAIVNSPGLPKLTGPVTVVRRTHHPHQTLNEVVDVAEGPTLAAVSIDGERLA